MGYFPNGTSGEYYQDQWCEHCKHWPPDPEDGMCPVWQIHLEHNYDQVQNEKLASILGALIPTKEIENLECKMFMPYDPMRCRDTDDLFGGQDG